MTLTANLRIAGALEKSTQVMTSMQQLIKVPEVMATMREMSKEMMKVMIRITALIKRSVACW